jgi:hypothetical protein
MMVFQREFPKTNQGVGVAIFNRKKDFERSRIATPGGKCLSFDSRHIRRFE